MELQLPPLPGIPMAAKNSESISLAQTNRDGGESSIGFKGSAEEDSGEKKKENKYVSFDKNEEET